MVSGGWCQSKKQLFVFNYTKIESPNPHIIIITMETKTDMSHCLKLPNPMKNDYIYTDWLKAGYSLYKTDLKPADFRKRFFETLPKYLPDDTKLMLTYLVPYFPTSKQTPIITKVYNDLRKSGFDATWVMNDTPKRFEKTFGVPTDTKAWDILITIEKHMMKYMKQTMVDQRLDPRKEQWTTEQHLVVLHEDIMRHLW